MGQILSDARVLSFFGHITEFTNGYNGTCGEAALEVCLACIDKRNPTTNHMVWITQDMASKKLLLNPNGESSIATLKAEAESLGYSINYSWDGSSQIDWHDLLLKNFGIKPILLMIANGQMLVDTQTGSADEHGLHYHVIAIGGGQTNGYICADGDNKEVSTQNQIYNYQSIANALPCGMIIFNMNSSQHNGGSGMQIPSGWTDDGITLKSPNEYPVTGGYRLYILNNPGFVPVAGWPIDNFKVNGGAVDILLFLNSALSWDGENIAIFDIGEYYRSQMKNMDNELTGLETNVTDLQNQLAGAEAQIKVLQNQQSGTMTPEAQSALDLVAQIKKTLGIS